MDFGEILQRVITVVVVLRIVGSLLRKVTGGTAAAAEAGEKTPLNRPLVEDGPEAHQGWAEQARVRFEEAVAKGERLIERAAELRAALPVRDARTADLRGVLQAGVEDPLGGAVARLTRGLTLIEAAEPGALEVLISEMPLYNRAFSTVYDGAIQVEIMSLVVAARVTGDGYLADADMAAKALLAPISAFAFAEGVPLPPQSPICVPTGLYGESVILNLFPDHPVIFVPQNFGSELQRWPAVAHEVGHVVWRLVPGLAEEAAGLSPSEATAWLPRAQGQRIVFDVGAAVGVWQEELFCDLMTVLLMGPAAVRGLMHAFESPDDPEAALRVSVGDDGRTVGTHPPVELRVRMACLVLDRLGFDREARALRRDWRQVHGEGTTLSVPSLLGSAIPVPLETVEALAASMVTALLDHPFDSLAGRTLESIPDLPVGPGLWGRAQRRTDDLVEGTPFNDDPRVVLMAGVEAAARSIRTTQALTVQMRRAIRAIDEAPVSDPHYTRRAAFDDGRLSGADVRDAIILQAFLNGGRGRWQPRGHVQSARAQRAHRPRATGS